MGDLYRIYLIAQRELYPKTWKRSILMLPMLMAVGVGLTIINTRAVLEALFGVETAFARTPKYAIGDRHVNLEVKKYRRRSGWLPYFEIVVGTYFVAMTIFATLLAGFYAKRTLTHQPIDPVDCAEAILFLAGDKSRCTSGHLIPVDGGLPEAFLR